MRDEAKIQIGNKLEDGRKGIANLAMLCFRANILLWALAIAYMAKIGFSYYTIYNLNFL